LKPEYIIGGPSVYNLLQELMRHYPEIKETIHAGFKTLVSSGAPVDNSIIRSFQKTFGIRMHNALGTTETQQVANTILYDNPDELDLASLGAPLPGVSIGLKKYSETDDLYCLYVQSPFGMKAIFNEIEGIDEGCPPGFIKTGDIVMLKKADRLIYVGRENVDFFKDGFGVKIPISSVKTYYRRLLDKTEHVEFYPVNSHPGLAGLIFINNPSLPRGTVLKKAVLDEYADLLNEINSVLFKTLMPFEFQYRTINRIAILNTPAPRTPKGNVSRNKIQSEFGALIEQLREPFSSDFAIKDIRSDSNDSFIRHLNPWVGLSLSNLGMDYHYHSAKKDTLFAFVNGKEIPVLDMLGGYGSNLIGHNNDEIKSAVMSFLNHDEVAISDQGSKQKHAGLLAEELNRLVGGVTGKDFNVILGSTGSEAVEIALHHALYEWKDRIDRIEQNQQQRYGSDAGRLCSEVWQKNREMLSSMPVHVITLKNAFHGNSSGPRALLGNRKKRTCFSNLLGIRAIAIDDESSQWEKELEDIFSAASVKINRVKSENGKFTAEEMSVSTIIAAIAEPITGEGGIRLVNRNLLMKLAQREYPLIMDEIQCGLGRAGSLLASEGISADYYLFAKALGGNLEKICAILIAKSRFKTGFGEYYSSTFANGALACKTALATLSIIERENVPQRAREKGQLLKDRLNIVKSNFPNAIVKITGKGLMQGIVLRDHAESGSIFMRNLYREELLGYVCSSYLLRRHAVRTLPSLSAPNVLRIEPSAFITDEEIDKFIRAIEDLSSVLSEERVYDLLKPMMDDDPFDDDKGKTPRNGWICNKVDAPHPGSKKTAFIAHFIHPAEDLRTIEKDLSKASDTGLRILQKRLQAILRMKPLLLFSKNLFHGKVHFSFYFLPIDTAELERLNRKGIRRRIVNQIQKTIDLAAGNGAEIVSLGAYTSIISKNGLSLVEPTNCKIVTGNTFTAASGIRRIITELGRRKLNKFRLGVIGAAGNIGAAIAMAMIDSGIHFEKIFLLGKSKGKLSKVLKEIANTGRDCNSIILSTDLTKLQQCNVIISSANTNDPIVFPHHISREYPVLISDLSVPASLAADVLAMSNVTVLNFSSYVKLPEDPDFILSSYTPMGASYCCAAEAMLLAMESSALSFKGKINIDSLHAIARLAEKYQIFEGIEEGISIL
jgi:acetylornithine/succinyldiaminopimelate/putrescine aminotransferase/predicted amino acid dehydrogenase